MPDITYVISRAPEQPASPGDPQAAQAPDRRRFEDALLAALAASGSTLLVPHVYYLGDGSPALARLAEVQADIVLGCWLHPRAAFWTLRSLGIDGTSGAAEPSSDEPGRKITCFDLGAFDSPDACADAMRGAAPPDAQPEPQASEAAIQDLTADLPPRWYPVLDYSRCTACRKCMDFCLFGCYALEDNSVLVAAPDECKPGCPACARLCPKEAIMFPHHAGDPAIAGAPGAKLADGRADVAAYLRAAEQAARERQACSLPSAAAGGRPAQSQGGVRDDLDELIDALDELDD